MKRFYMLSLSAVLLFGCKSKVQQIVDQSIAVHGGEAFEQIHIKFDFRGMHYDLQRDNGKYTYQRIQTDSLGNKITDILSNDSFIRRIGNEVTDLPDTTSAKYANSVNSVAYFILLPFGLNDASVNKEWLKETKINDQAYDEVKVTFDAEGGGKDHQDVFLFWFNKETHMMDYLAYSYETSGGGVRFREAIKQHKTGNFIFQDYRNYGLEDAAFPLSDLPVLFEKGELPLLSNIENENITLVP